MYKSNIQKMNKSIQKRMQEPESDQIETPKKKTKMAENGSQETIKNQKNKLSAIQEIDPDDFFEHFD